MEDPYEVESVQRNCDQLNVFYSDSQCLSGEGIVALYTAPNPFLLNKICLNQCLLFTDFCDHLSKHGDGVKDVAFSVEDLDAIYKVRID